MTDTHMNDRNCNILNISSDSLPQEPQVLGYGCILLCEQGTITLKVEFNYLHLYPGECLTLFPTDIVQFTSKSDNFSGRALTYSDDLLREASMHVEQSVYSSLRKDRICHERNIVEDVVKPMFTILTHYFNVKDCAVTDDIATMQLKIFFLGFYDFLRRHPELRPGETESERTNELFTKFMETLEHEFMVSRDVQYYADRLFITRKYLGIIVRRKTEKTPKQLINEYVITQLKLRLRNSNDSIRQIASAFHFADDSIMIRYFKAHTGVTPVQFRRTPR